MRAEREEHSKRRVELWRAKSSLHQEIRHQAWATYENGGVLFSKMILIILGYVTAIVAIFYAFFAVILAVLIGWRMLFLILLILGALEMALATKKIWRL